MVKKEASPKKKLSIKTRLIIIGIMFVLVYGIFYVFDDEPKSDELESDEPTKPLIDKLLDEKPEEETEDELYYKFNPPSP